MDKNKEPVDFKKSMMYWHERALSAELESARFHSERIEMHAAIFRQVENIEHWIETGIPANEEESRSIYEQLCMAIGVVPK